MPTEEENNDDVKRIDKLDINTFIDIRKNTGIERFIKLEPNKNSR